MNYIEDLNKLLTNQILTIEKLEFWLLKYYNLKKESENSDLIRPEKLPDKIESTKEENFLDLYNNLEIIADLYKNEKYFKSEIEDFYSAKNSKVEIQNWLRKNEELGSQKYITFLLDYLDYGADNNEHHLKIFIPSNKNLNIFIDRNNFINTIQFLEIFNNLYWKE